VSDRQRGAADMLGVAQPARNPKVDGHPYFFPTFGTLAVGPKSQVSGPEWSEYFPMPRLEMSHRLTGDRRELVLDIER